MSRRGCVLIRMILWSFRFHVMTSPFSTTLPVRGSHRGLAAFFGGIARLVPGSAHHLGCRSRWWHAVAAALFSELWEPSTSPHLRQCLRRMPLASSPCSRVTPAVQLWMPPPCRLCLCQRPMRWRWRCRYPLQVDARRAANSGAGSERAAQSRHISYHFESCRGAESWQRRSELPSLRAAAAVEQKAAAKEKIKAAAVAMAEAAAVTLAGD
eukprot:6833800-Prymnesium_polylepis.1